MLTHNFQIDYADKKVHNYDMSGSFPIREAHRLTEFRLKRIEMETTVYDLAKMLKGLTGCTIVPLQYVPGGQLDGKQNDALMRRCADFGEELSINGVIDGRERPRGKLFLCVFREDFEAGEPFKVHLYTIRPEIEEMFRQRSKASSSFGELFAVGLVQ